MGEPIQPNTQNIAYGLIGAYALVYIGQAVRFDLLSAVKHLKLTFTVLDSACSLWAFDKSRLGYVPWQPDHFYFWKSSPF
jgi:hypothetical protein